jgi:hypothetical protein
MELAIINGTYRDCNCEYCARERAKSRSNCAIDISSRSPSKLHTNIRCAMLIAAF